MPAARFLPLVALGLLLAATPVPGQEAAPAAPSVTVSGVVFDSLARAPLAAATVQIVPADERTEPRLSTVSDAEGRFAFAGVEAGRYLVGFLHPVLDSLGLDPIARAYTVPRGGELHVTLAVPGPARLRSAHCGGQGDGGAIMGFVRAAQGGAPVADATVTGSWSELSIGGGEIAGRTAHRVATTGANGGFVLCDVPGPGTVRLAASRGGIDTDALEVDVPSDGLLRRDLYLGESRAVVADAAPAPDVPSPPASSPEPRTGTGRLVGTVVAADGGAPMAGVEVRIVDGAPTRTNERGEWTLTRAPSGTRVLEVRAPGYAPVRRAVDVVDGVPPVRVELIRRSAMLDTLRVVAPGLSHFARSGFEHRRRTYGIGRYYSAADLAKLPLHDVSDLFVYVPGVGYNGDTISMRGTFTESCLPAVFLNGHHIVNVTTDILNTFVRPGEVAGVEVYRESQAPPQFRFGMSDCGSIVIWTK